MNPRPSPFTQSLEAILTAHSLETEIKAAKDLALSYQKLIGALEIEDPYEQREATDLDGGIALSSRHALDCLDDPLRTVRFISGTYAAVQDALTIFTERPLQLLYAGCGPAAPLMLPFLHEFDPEEISLTLLDITPTSLTSVKNLVDHLGLGDYIRSYELQDAITYKHPDGLDLHFVVSETMDIGLTKEPQVRITQNLAPQLNTKGILVPEAIEVYTQQSRFKQESYEDWLQPDKQSDYEVSNTEHLFTIDKEIDTGEVFWFESKPIKKPEDFSNTPDISVYAKVKIYKNYVLEKSQSLISTPICVNNFYNISGQAYRLKHTTKGIPSWETIDSDN